MEYECKAKEKAGPGRREPEDLGKLTFLSVEEQGASLQKLDVASNLRGAVAQQISLSKGVLKPCRNYSVNHKTHVLSPCVMNSAKHSMWA